MTRRQPTPYTPPAVTTERLWQYWADLNARYFRNALPPIEIVWSRRLTSSAGMFAGRVGPRAPDAGSARRCIRLSVPLLLGHTSPSPSPLPHQNGGEARQEYPRPCFRGEGWGEVVATLAHEMIHQWQFDVLKRRPNHGPDFRRKMAEMNRDGLGITVRHALDEAVQALTKYIWRCLGCGKVYRRQRRTIRPSRHRCGCCRGALRELIADSTKEPMADS